MEHGRACIKKRQAAKLQNGKCFYCTLRLPLDDMTWEHLVPRAHGGSSKWSNLRVAHQACNVLVADAHVSLKLRLHDIAQEWGSDAFFVTAEKVMPHAPGVLAIVGAWKRARRMKQHDWQKMPASLQDAFEEGERLAQEILRREMEATSNQANGVDPLRFAA